MIRLQCLCFPAPCRTDETAARYSTKPWSLQVRRCPLRAYILLRHSPSWDEYPMIEFLTHLLSSQGFEAHGHCYLWLPEILWLHVSSDAFIALAYYSIPIALIYLIHKRRDLTYGWMVAMFGAFILLCGTTHVMNLCMVWNVTYCFVGFVILLTGAVSINI